MFSTGVSRFSTRSSCSAFRFSTKPSCSARFPISPTTSRARVSASQRVGGNGRLLLTPGNRFAPLRTHLAYGTRTQPIAFSNPHL